MASAACGMLNNNQAEHTILYCRVTERIRYQLCRVRARIFFFFRHHFRQFDFFGANFFKFGPFIASHINLMMKVISCNLST